MSENIEVATIVIKTSLDEAYSLFTRLLPIEIANETDESEDIIACHHELLRHGDEYDDYYDDDGGYSWREVSATFTLLDDPAKTIAKIVLAEHQYKQLYVRLWSGTDYKIENKRYWNHMVDFYKDLHVKLTAKEDGQHRQVTNTPAAATQAFQWPPPDQRLLTFRPAPLHTTMHIFSEAFPTFMKTDFPQISSELTYHETFWQYVLSLKGKQIIELRLFSTQSREWILLQMTQIDRPEWFTAAANVMDVYNFYVDFWSKLYGWAHTLSDVVQENGKSTYREHGENTVAPENTGNSEHTELNDGETVETLEPNGSSQKQHKKRKIASDVILRLYDVVQERQQALQAGTQIPGKIVTCQLNSVEPRTLQAYMPKLYAMWDTKTFAPSEEDTMRLMQELVDKHGDSEKIELAWLYKE